MRYYVISIQYNKDAQAENRTVPKAFNDLDSAIAYFHTGMGINMKDSTLGWALWMVINSDGGIYRNEKWTREESPVTE